MIDLNETEVSAILDAFVYLDDQRMVYDNLTLGKIMDHMSDGEGNLKKEYYTKDKNGNLKTENKAYFDDIKAAIRNHPELAEYTLVSQSAINGDHPIDSDLLWACTFRSPEGAYYVSYRGTGDGKWVDNGEGMYEPSTVMQKAAAEYFDSVVELQKLTEADRIIVSGHSKGGNSAQYVTLASNNCTLVDACYSFDGQGFSDAARSEFIRNLGEAAYQAQLSKMYSINGENDPVHELGFVVIPSENTYYVNVEDNSGLEGIHGLQFMLIKGEINLDLENRIDQGPIGKFAKKLSEEMMKLNDEDLRDCALSVMFLIESLTNRGEYIYNATTGGYESASSVGTGNLKDATYEEFCGFISLGIPLILKTAITTEEGRATVGILAMEAINGIASSENGGWKLAGIVGLVLICAPAIISVGEAVWAGATIIDSVGDLLNGDFELSDVTGAFLATKVIGKAALLLAAIPYIVVAVLTTIAIISLVVFVVNNWENIKAFVEGVGDFVVGAMTAVYAWAENLASQAASLVKSAIGKAVKLYQNAKEAIVDLGNRLMSAMTSFFSSVSQMVMNFLGSVGAWVKGLFGDGSSALAYGGQIVVAVSYIENLQRGIGTLRNKYLDLDNIARDVDGVVTHVYNYYKESYVRSCCRDAQNELKNAQKYASGIERELERKRRVLASAVESYRQADQSAERDIRNFSFGFS